MTKEPGCTLDVPAAPVACHSRVLGPPAVELRPGGPGDSGLHTQ